MIMDNFAAVCYVLSIFLVGNCSAGKASSDDADADLLCRDSWISNLSFPLYAQYTCAKCFHQVFFGEKALVIDRRFPYILFLKENTSIWFYPDAERQDSQVCEKYLSEQECSKWQECCSAAKECCRRSSHSQNVEGYCPATWDGVACWEATKPEVLASQRCPDYIQHPELAWVKPKATRQCEVNGTWFVHPVFGSEQSDYSQCIDTSKNEEIIRISLYVGMACKSLSLLFLMGAIVLTAILPGARAMLKQNADTKMHLNLYIALLFMSALWLVMDVVHYKKLQGSDAIENQIWCRVIHGLAKYFLCASYMCLFCEGLHLHRRFTNIMHPVEDKLLKYYLIAWVLPGILVIIYITARICTDNTGCWIDYELSYLELIYFIPNSLTYIINFFFLVRILISVCKSMRTDTSDRRSLVLRQSVRALFYLIPIFGLQFLFIAYRPMWPPYEIIVAVCIGLQGTVATILYFYTNREIKNELRLRFCRCCLSHLDIISSHDSLNYTGAKPPHFSPTANGESHRKRNASLASTMYTSATCSTINRNAHARSSFKSILERISGKAARGSVDNRIRRKNKEDVVLKDMEDTPSLDAKIYTFQRSQWWNCNEQGGIAYNNGNSRTPQSASNGVPCIKIQSERQKDDCELYEKRARYGSWNGMSSEYINRTADGKSNIPLLARSVSCNDDAISNSNEHACHEISDNDTTRQKTCHDNTTQLMASHDNDTRQKACHEKDTTRQNTCHDNDMTLSKQSSKLVDERYLCEPPLTPIIERRSTFGSKT